MRGDGLGGWDESDMPGLDEWDQIGDEDVQPGGEAAKGHLRWRREGRGVFEDFREQGRLWILQWGHGISIKGESAGWEGGV